MLHPVPAELAQLGGRRRAIKQQRAKETNSHQQAGFTAGTIADDDELSADLSHDF